MRAADRATRTAPPAPPPAHFSWGVVRQIALRYERTVAFCSQHYLRHCSYCQRLSVLVFKLALHISTYNLTTECLKPRRKFNPQACEKTTHPKKPEYNAQKEERIYRGSNQERKDPLYQICTHQKQLLIPQETNSTVNFHITKTSIQSKS